MEAYMGGYTTKTNNIQSLSVWDNQQSQIYLVYISLSDVVTLFFIDDLTYWFFVFGIAWLNKFRVLLFKTCFYVDSIAMTLFSLTATASLRILTGKTYSSAYEKYEYGYLNSSHIKSTLCKRFFYWDKIFKKIT